MVIIKELKIPIDSSLFEDVSMLEEPLLAAAQKYKRHPSIHKITGMIRQNDLFYFHHDDCDIMLTILQNISCKKAARQGGIPVGIIKECKFVFSQFISQMFNFYIDNNFCTDYNVYINPAYMKNDPFEKTNYWPIRIVPVLSKAFERCLYDQIYEYINNILSNAQFGFRKAFRTQYLLMTMNEKWRKKLDKGGLTDSSKAFDSIVHEFLIAKLEAFGFSYEAFKVTYNYLTKEKKHRTKINNSFIDFIHLPIGIPQGSVLCHLLFNNYTCNLFFFIEKAMSYADDTTPYPNGDNVVTILDHIETDGKMVFNWFSMNYLKASPGKSQLLLSSKEEVFITIENTTIKNSSSKKLLGVLTDNKLTFNI